MAANPRHYLVSEAEYLEHERTAEEKSEYMGGYITMMAGASREHGTIVTNLAGELRAALRARPCDVLTNDMRVHDPITRSYLYPDVVVVCGEPRFLDRAVDTLLNPTVIIEVLSSSTERRDRGKKSWAYRQIPSLREHILVSQEYPHVERLSRQPDGAWYLHDFQGMDAALEIASIGCSIPFSEIYLKVAFSDEA